MNGRVPQLVLAAALFWLVLVLPARPVPLTQVALRLSAELPLLLALLCLGGRTARLIATLALFLLAVLKLADLVTHGALGRGFNPIADPPLLDAAVRLIAGSMGWLAAAATVAGVLLLSMAIPLALWWAAGVWTRPESRPLQPRAAAVVAIGIVAGMGLIPPSAANFAYGAAQLDLARSTLGQLGQLRRAARDDPHAGRSGLLDAIDRDVLVIFIESYGRASFDDAFLAERHLTMLHHAEARLTEAGFSMRSGFVTAPTQGGQSWLSHATLANGLWITDQGSYRAVLASGRLSLFHYAQRSGFETAAVMPAITRAWPEARSMGFDRVLAAPDLGYRGPAFNWMTMPDQFTLMAVERLLRGTAGGHQFLQVALISSHAPWTPVPWMLPWERVETDDAFDEMARSGAAPREVWADPDRLRRHYRGSVDYALQAVFGHVARQGDNAPLFFILGDHQAAPSISGGENRDVALHVIGPEALVARIAPWGFQPGLVPAMDSAAVPMNHLRDMILDSFTDQEAPS